MALSQEGGLADDIASQLQAELQITVEKSPASIKATAEIKALDAISTSLKTRKADKTDTFLVQRILPQLQALLESSCVVLHGCLALFVGSVMWDTQLSASPESGPSLLINRQGGGSHHILLPVGCALNVNSTGTEVRVGRKERWDSAVSGLPEMEVWATNRCCVVLAAEVQQINEENETNKGTLWCSGESRQWGVLLAGQSTQVAHSSCMITFCVQEPKKKKAPTPDVSKR